MSTPIRDAVSPRKQDPAGRLVDYLTVEPLDVDSFGGWCHGGAPGRAMGGQLAAQALAAACATVVEERVPHSLHGHFLAMADPRQMIGYRVERLRDGRTYTARRVTAVQDGVPVFTLSASFKSYRPDAVGPDRQPVMPEVRPPEGLVDAFDVWATLNPEAHRVAPYAHVATLRIAATEPGEAARASAGERIRQAVWIRTSEKLADEAHLHACALTYLSDISLAQTSALDHQAFYLVRPGPARFNLASLDHSIWFHRPFRADEWLLYAQTSPTAADGRSFTRGELYRRNGSLVASVAQESVLRSVHGDGMSPT